LARTPAAPQAGPAADLLEKILEKTAIYCRRLGNASLVRRAPQEKEEFFDVVYAVPAEAVAGKQKVTVRFEGIEGRETGTIFGIRVVRAAGDRR